MEDYAAIKPSHLKINEALRLCKDTTDIDVIIDLTKHESPQVRFSLFSQQPYILLIIERGAAFL